MICLSISKPTHSFLIEWLIEHTNKFTVAHPSDELSIWQCDKATHYLFPLTRINRKRNGRTSFWFIWQSFSLWTCGLRLTNASWNASLGWTLSRGKTDFRNRKTLLFRTKACLNVSWDTPMASLLVYEWIIQTLSFFVRVNRDKSCFDILMCSRHMSTHWAPIIGRKNACFPTATFGHLLYAISLILWPIAAWYWPTIGIYSAKFPIPCRRLYWTIKALGFLLQFTCLSHSLLLFHCSWMLI